MSTSYYTMTSKLIGVRVYGGLYCYDCRTALAKDTYSTTSPSKCAKCGKEYKKALVCDAVQHGIVGSNITIYKPKSGVQGYSIFYWKMPKSTLDCIGVIRDEYNTLITPKQFKEIIEECAVQRERTDDILLRN